MEDENNSEFSNKRVGLSWKRFVVPILLVSIVTAIIFLINVSEEWFVNQKITDYEFEGIEVSDSKLLSDKVKTISFGKTKDSILLKKIETELEKDLYIEKCVANFESESKIRIEIEERVPIAFYLDEGHLKYLDKEGIILPYKVLKKYSDLIVVSGLNKKQKDLRKASLQILNVINSSDIVKMFASELRYMNKNKGFELIGPFENIKIYLGLEDNIKQKIEKLKILMTNRSAQELLVDTKSIDLRWSDRIIIEEI